MADRLTRQGVRDLDDHRNARRSETILHGVCRHDWRAVPGPFWQTWEECRRCGERRGLL